MATLNEQLKCECNAKWDNERAIYITFTPEQVF